MKVNVDMTGAIRAIEGLTGKKFIHYDTIAVTQDLEAQYKAQWVRDYIESNTTMVEVSQVEATEMVEVDIPTGLYIGEVTTGYEIVGGEVNPQTELIPETHKVMKVKVKDTYHFDTTDGKFYRTTRPTMEEADSAAVSGFKFTPPKWLVDRLK